MTKFEPKVYFKKMANFYDVTPQKLQSVNQINNWVSKKTHGRINRIIDNIPKELKLLLINVVYFKGKWKYQFKKLDTQKKEFYNLGKKEKKVDMMYICKNLRYNEDSKMQIVELPYDKDSMSAIIILPKKGENINNFINNLNDKYIYEKIEKLNSCKVSLNFPKFKFEKESNIKNALYNMGIKLAFSEIANFSKLTDQKRFGIGDVNQKVFIKVDEEGTEAIAVTSVRMGPRPMMIRREKIYYMNVNRPFLFFIRNNKMSAGNDLLFMAKIENM